MSAARDLATLGNQSTLKVDTTDTRIGINSTSPDSTLDVGGNVEVSGVSTFSGNTHVGSAISMYASAGIVSATSFYGDGSALTGTASTDYIITGTAATFNNKVNINSTLTCSEGIHVSAGVATFASNVTVGGVLTYEDVSNVDSVGLVTARTGVRVTAGGLVVTAGVSTFGGTIDTATFDTNSSGAVVTGICTVTTGSDLDGYKVEEGVYDTTALNGEFDFELEDGHVQTHTGSTAGTYFPDFKVSSGVSLNEVMDVGDIVSCTLIVAASNTSHYCTTGIKIDNSTSNVTIEWIGSSAPTAGKGAGYDVYGFTIQKTAATPAYLVIVNATDAG